MKKVPDASAAGTSKKFDIRIKFVSDTMNAPNVIWCFWCDLEFVPEIADMVVYCPVGVIVKIFVPYKINNHVICEYPAGVHNEQSKYVKLFHCQHDLSLANIY